MTKGTLRSAPACGRCQRVVKLSGRRWPEGPICSGCYVTAMETYAPCARCGRHRLTPGLDGSSAPLCVPCSGINVSCRCDRCGKEALRHSKNLCGHCVLADRLAVLLDDGTGQINPDLKPFHDHFCSMPRPRSGILWLTKPHVPPILRALATGQTPLTHDGLSTLTPRRSVIHLRDLLIASGVLPPADRFLILFQQWLDTWLDDLDPDHRKVLERFATWHILRRLRASSARAPIGYGRNQSARSTLVKAAGFCTWLTARGRTLSTCTQADIDAFFAQSHEVRPGADTFLKWCVTNQAMPKLTIPSPRTEASTPIGARQRLDLIRRLTEDEALDLRDRVVALLVLLFAQDVVKITGLALDDVIQNEGRVSIVLGTDPTPVPAPFDALVIRYINNRSNLATATNPGSTLLFPGRRAGQPIHPTTLRLRLAAAGIPNLSGRTAALRQLLLHAPAPVVALMLGYAPTTTTRIAEETGDTYKNYAPRARHT
jgi:site-specific recombinase XerC